MYLIILPSVEIFDFIVSATHVVWHDAITFTLRNPAYFDLIPLNCVACSYPV